MFTQQALPKIGEDVIVSDRAYLEEPRFRGNWGKVSGYAKTGHGYFVGLDLANPVDGLYVILVHPESLEPAL